MHGIYIMAFEVTHLQCVKYSVFIKICPKIYFDPSVKAAVHIAKFRQNDTWLINIPANNSAKVHHNQSFHSQQSPKGHSWQVRTKATSTHAECDSKSILYLLHHRLFFSTAPTC
jgi:hypothetical protein